MKSEQIDTGISPLSVGPLDFSPVVQKLTAIGIVKVVLFTEAEVCPTAGCAPRLESFSKKTDGSFDDLQIRLPPLAWAVHELARPYITGIC
jgi:hypothetical protein